MPEAGDEEELEIDASRSNTYRPYYIPFHPKPVDVHRHVGDDVFIARPFFGPLLFDNVDSDARDHCANERSTLKEARRWKGPSWKLSFVSEYRDGAYKSIAFLSYLRLSVYMSIVAVAILVSFHLKHQPTALELRMAMPLGIIFWFLSLSCLALGFGNYVKTVTKYSRRMAIVQTGWKTQVIFTMIALSIVGVCIIFLSTDTTTH